MRIISILDLFSHEINVIILTERDDLNNISQAINSHRKLTKKKKVDCYINFKIYKYLNSCNLTFSLFQQIEIITIRINFDHFKTSLFTILYNSPEIKTLFLDILYNRFKNIS